jgi:hypothetical protein
VLGDLLDADVLTGAHRAQVEIVALEADAANNA